MLTDFAHYLRNNQAPSECEVREIKALKVNAVHDISLLHAEIERIETTLNALKRKRANIQNSIDDCNTILAPVRRLSMDDWAVIFTHCLATHRNPIMSASEAPILITQICSGWRSIALSIPLLWSRIHIPLLGVIQREQALSHVHERERRIEARSEEVQKWLRLSGACPLSITIIPNSERESHQPPLDAIIHSSRRWKQLELGYLAPNSNVWKKIISLSADDLCMLQELRLHSVNKQALEDLWCQSNLFAAQGLRSIHIGEVARIDIFPKGIPPNWQNLSHLFIHSRVLLRIANQILSHCHNLVACLLKVSTITDSFTLLSFPLPHLKFLSLKGSYTGCSRILYNIQAPSLQALDCHGYFPNENEGCGLLNCLQSIDSLDTLMMSYKNLTKNSIFKFGTLIPSLKHLVFGQASVFSLHSQSAELMTALYEMKHQYSPHSAPTVLFPSLEVFEAYQLQNVTDRTLLEFIIARIDATRSNTGVSKLRRVLVQFARTRETDIVPAALAYAQAAGMELELDLMYENEAKPFDRNWSPSCGISVDDDTSWLYDSHGY